MFRISDWHGSIARTVIIQCDGENHDRFALDRVAKYLARAVELVVIENVVFELNLS